MNKKIAYFLGRPLSPLYSLAMRLRERCYYNGIFRRNSFGVPVISVGNLTMGGTGKTPMVKYLARLLQDQGFRPAVISRGYGGATKEPVNVVSDGDSVLLGAEFAGDEPCMLAQALPGVLVLTGVVRKLPAERAVEMGADVLLLDDGFQHMAVNRDLDLVLFHADSLAGNSRVFPGGDLREPVKALLRCQAFVLTGTNADNRGRAQRFADLLTEKFPDHPVFFCENKAVGVVRRDREGRESAADVAVLADLNPFAFCGIARPESFKETLAQIGVSPAGFQPLPDHHVYRRDVVRHLLSSAEKSGADCLLCTEKDLVKLRGFDLPLPMYALSTEVGANVSLDEYILENVARWREQRKS